MIYQLPSTFFGLRPKHKPQIHEEIFQLLYYGNGFVHSDVYEMPVYLRKFYFQKLNEYKKKESKEIEKAQQKKPNIAKPSFVNPRINK